MHWQSWRVVLCCDSVDESSKVSEGPQGEWRCSGAGECGGAGSADRDKECRGPQPQRCRIYSVMSKNIYELMASLKALISKPFIWVKEFLVDVIQIFQSIKFILYQTLVERTLYNSNCYWKFYFSIWKSMTPLQSVWSLPTIG